jgi:hypothetical protein
MKNKSQPIAIQNVIDYLLAALINPNGRDGIFEIGGPDITSYGDLMLRYARIRGLRRSMLLVPGIPLWFMAFGVGLMTPVPYPIAYALIGGLSADSVVKHPEALTVFPEVKLIDFDTAAKDALEKTHPAHIERVWDNGNPAAKSIKHEGCFIDYREMRVDVRAETIMNEIAKIDSCEKIFPFGKQWIEWSVRHATGVTYMSQTVFFCPRGLVGFLYWYILYPFHMLHFRGLIRKHAQAVVLGGEDAS